jgi:hypothetical protein
MSYGTVPYSSYPTITIPAPTPAAPIPGPVLTQILAAGWVQQDLDVNGEPLFCYSGLHGFYTWAEAMAVIFAQLLNSGQQSIFE